MNTIQLFFVGGLFRYGMVNKHAHSDSWICRSCLHNCHNSHHIPWVNGMGLRLMQWIVLPWTTRWMGAAGSVCVCGNSFRVLISIEMMTMMTMTTRMMMTIFDFTEQFVITTAMTNSDCEPKRLIPVHVSVSANLIDRFCSIAFNIILRWSENISQKNTQHQYIPYLDHLVLHSFSTWSEPHLLYTK